MPKNKLQELDEILAKSQRLASNIGDSTFSSAPLNYRVAELSEATRQLGDNARVPAATSSGATGVASDAKRVLDEINNIALKGTEEKTPGMEGVSLDNYLAHHHDMICLTALQASQAMSQQSMEDMQRRWLVAEWESTRNDFVESLGHRSSASAVPSTPLLLLEHATSGLSTQPTALSALQTRHAEVVKTIALACHASQTPLHPPRPCTDLAGALAAYHPEQDQTLLSKADLLGYKTLLDMLAHMVGETRFSTDDKRPKTALAAGAGAGGDSASTHKPGYFASICYEKEKLSSTKLTTERHLLLTQGTLNYYNHLAQDAYAGAGGGAGVGVVGSPSLGLRAPGSTLRHLIKSHIHAALPKDAISIFAYLYYLLRAGAYRAAVEEVEDYNHSVQKAAEVDSHLLYVLKALAHYGDQLTSQANASSAAGAATATPLRSPSEVTPDGLAQALASVHKAYKAEHIKFSSPQGDRGVDVYKLLVMNLMGIVDKSWYATGYGVGEYSLEDFMWAHVFTIYLKQIYQHVQGSVDSFSLTSPFMKRRDDNAVTATDYIGEHEELLELIHSYGGSGYFDASHSVYKYCMILIACHRFGDALHYIFLHDKTFVYSHLCVIMLYYGLILPHNPLQCNPALPVVSAQGVADTCPHVLVTAYLSKVLTPVLASYSNPSSTQAKGLVKIMTDYIIHIHSNYLVYSYNFEAGFKEMYKQKTSMYAMNVLQDFILSLPSAHCEVVVGVVSESGARCKGAIDEYLTAVEAGALLQKLAYAYKNAFHDYKSAFHYLLLSGQYLVLLQDMIDLLVTTYSTFYHSIVHGPAQGPPAARHSSEVFMQWYLYVEDFIQRYLRSDSASSLLPRYMSIENSQRLIDSLIYVHNIFTATKVHLYDGQCEDALDMFSTLQVIPDNQGASGILHGSATAKIADEVLCIYAQCLHTVFSIYKQRLAQGAKGDYLYLQEKLGQVRLKLQEAYHYAFNNKQFLRSREATLHEIQKLCAPAL